MKEIIIAECDGDDTIHCCRYEQGFDYDKSMKSDMFPEDEASQYPSCGSHFMITIFTKKTFPQGKVKITIETLEDENEP